ncbi:DUF4249 family protein [bacterium]|nr:DUF4249 family protein [bacterium]
MKLNWKLQWLSAVLLITLILVSTGCDEDSPLAAGNSLLVVEAYLFAGQPVTHVKLSETYAISGDDSTAPPVNNAVVQLIKGNQSYILEKADGDSGWYHYTGNDLIIEKDDTFSLEIQHDDQIIRAETTVPAAPAALTLDDSTLGIMDFSNFTPGSGFDRDAMTITLSWTAEDEALYYVVIENIEANPEEISEGGMFSGKGPGLFITEPNPRNEYRITQMAVTHYGRHIAKVYRVNQEYADLYQSRQQDTRDLNEPLTNIEGGLGVFSAFNSSTINFTVVQTEN